MTWFDAITDIAALALLVAYVLISLSIQAKRA